MASSWAPFVIGAALKTQVASATSRTMYALQNLAPENVFVAWLGSLFISLSVIISLFRKHTTTTRASKMDSSYEDLSRSRHSCRYCQRIVIEPSASVFNDASPWQPFKSFINGFEFSLREIVDASENSCVLFQRIVRDLTQDFFEYPPPDVQWYINNHPDRRIRLHFQIEPATFDAINADPPYICLISWLWEWANEAKDTPAWCGVDRNTYELCSEPGIY
jgi:hypothetical protein